MTTYAVAVVGCGHWGPNHARAFDALPGVSVTWAVDVSAERRHHMSTTFGQVRVTSRYQDVLDDASVDAVVVATPAATHAEIALAALRAGKHVLCEKPLGLSSIECSQLVEAASSSGVILVVGHVFLFNAGIVKLKRLVDAGALGRISYASAVHANLWPIRQDVNAAWDLASHEVAIFNFLFDSTPISVSASGHATRGHGMEDVAFLTLRYPENVMVGVMVSWIHPQKIRQVSVVGETRMATFDDLAPSPLTLYSHPDHAPLEPYYDSYGEFHLLARVTEATTLAIRPVEPLREQARCFIDAIVTGQAGPAAGERGWDVVRTLEAVSTSMERAGAAVEVPGRTHAFASK